MAKQVIYRRGTTAEHANFVGANGEITVDTVKHVVIVHDGVTAGGFPLANASTITANISTLTANAANQAAAITVLQANAATQSANIATLVANAAAQQASITAFTLASNSTVIFADIAGVRANVEAANVQIGLLFGNATIQSESITAANANITALQANIAAANTAIAGIVTGTTFVTQTAFSNNLTAVNSAVSTQGVTFATNVAVAGVTANVTAANLEISRLQANIAAANVAINNIALSPALIDLVALAVSPVVTNGAFYSNSNLAGYLSSQNITSANASINTINANVTAANAAIQSLSANIGTLVAGAPGALDTLIELGTALGNNASFSSTMVTWLSNITSNVTAANGSITTLQTQVYANANVSAYLSNGVSGDITIQPVYGGTRSVIIKGGGESFGTAGAVTLESGVGGGASARSGNINITASGASTGYGGHVFVRSGSGYYVSGDVNIIAASGTNSPTSTDGNVNVTTKTGTWNFDAGGNLTLPESGYLKVGAGIVAGFASSPAPVISGFSSISAENFTFQGNGVNILTTVAGTYANANVKAFLAAEVEYDGAYQRKIQGYYANLDLSATAALYSFGVTSKSYLGHNGLVGNTGISTVTVDNYDIKISTNNAAYNWTFDNTGSLTLPNGAVIRDTAGDAIAFGQNAGQTSQGSLAVAIGSGAGYANQGGAAVAIGYNAGLTSQGNNSIILNATGSALDQTTPNTFTVAPVRNDVSTANVAQVMFYNTTSKEITYGNTISIAGNLSVAGNVVQQSAYYETYSNVTNSGGNLTCNFVNSATFYATLTANVTVNFTNVVATAGRVTGATLIVDQGATAYRVANIQINSGGVQTVKYAGGTPNTGTASNTDVMSFSLISLDGTNWRVLGQISNYG